ncbi:addiction module toxin RelE [Candidatus Woesearchaeota archaeon]|nr:addiction module toxin RelE [Candidatus Woesearchaeota archaeon]
MFDFDLREELKAIIHKLSKKDQKRAEIINKKIKEIISCDHQSIDHYKNLRHHLKHLKRVHIDSSFVLTFTVDKEKNFILFIDFDHHDNIY